MTNISRHKTRQVRVGHALIGGGAPVLVQSMTNTDTADAGRTAAQVFELARAGSEIVRVTVNTAEAAAQVPRIRERDRKSTRLNSSHLVISYAVFCLKKKKKTHSNIHFSKKKYIMNIIIS